MSDPRRRPIGSWAAIDAYEDALDGFGEFGEFGEYEDRSDDRPSLDEQLLYPEGRP